MFHLLSWQCAKPSAKDSPNIISLSNQCWKLSIPVCLFTIVIHWTLVSTTPPSPIFLCWDPNPQYNGIRMWEVFGRWLGCQGRIYALMKEISLLPFSMWGRSVKTVVSEPGSGLWPDTKFASILSLGFPPSRTVRNKCLNHLVYSIFVVAVWIDSDHHEEREQRSYITHLR